MHDNDEQFRLLAENAGDAIFRFRHLPPPGFEYVSASVEGITGYKPEDFYADPNLGYRLVHPEDVPLVEAFRSPGRGLGGALILRLLRKDGTWVWVEQRHAGVYDNKGDLVAIEGMVRDISDRVAAEESLRRNEIRLAEAQHLARIGSWEWDIAADSVHRSDQLFRIFGLAPQQVEVTYASFLDRIHPGDREFVDATIQRAYADHQPFAFDQRIVLPDGSERIVHSQGRVVVDEEGNPVRMTGTAQDITESKRAEESLQHLAAIVESSDEAMISATADGTIVSWNPAAERIYGHAAHEVTGGLLSITVARDQSNELREIIDSVTTKGLVAHYETLRLSPDGHRIDVTVTVSPIRDRAGGIIGLVAVSHDVTERKRAVEELNHQRHQLRALSRRLVEVQEAERRHIARELHDEIGQVLTGLKLVLEAAPRPLEESVGNAVEKAQKLVEDLMAIVRDMSHGLRPPMLDDLGLQPTLRWLIERYSVQSGVRIFFEYSGPEKRFDPEVETAAFRIAQEALTNVARHSGTSEAALRVLVTEGRLRVEVEDGGKGFDPDVVPITASGLTGIRERVVALGGSLTVESAPGKGARLTAELPLDGDHGS